MSVEVDTLFFPKDHEPLLNHEYQLLLAIDAAYWRSTVPSHFWTPVRGRDGWCFFERSRTIK